MQVERIIGGRYSVIQILGKGGMGDVFLAEDRKLPRRVAIKSIRMDLSKDSEMRKRLERESQLHARIGPHTHIVTLYDLIEENDQIHLVMEYVEGENLQEFLARLSTGGQGMPVDGALEIVDQTLDALSCIHRHNIVHRDIKPGNLLLTRCEDEGFRVKLMDFGIARREADDDSSTNITRADARSPGTPLYMAPEQIDAHTFGKVSPATDFYAVGVMLYQILCGQPPFKGTLTEIYNAHLNSPPPDLPHLPDESLSAPLNELIKKALAKDPVNRFRTADEFRKALAKVSGAAAPRAGIMLPRATDPSATLLESDAQNTDIQSGHTQLSTTGKTTRGSGGSKAWMAAAAVVLLAAVGGGAWMIMGKGSTESVAEPPAVTQSEPPATTTADQPLASTDPQPPSNTLATQQLPDNPPPNVAPISNPPAAIPAAASDPALTPDPPMNTQTSSPPATQAGSSASDALRKNRAEVSSDPVANNQPATLVVDPPVAPVTTPPATVVAQDDAPPVVAKEPEPVKTEPKPASTKKSSTRAKAPAVVADTPAPQPAAPKSGSAGSWSTTTKKKTVEKVTP